MVHNPHHTACYPCSNHVQQERKGRCRRRQKNKGPKFVRRGDWQEHTDDDEYDVDMKQNGDKDEQQDTAHLDDNMKNTVINWLRKRGAGAELTNILRKIFCEDDDRKAKETQPEDPWKTLQSSGDRLRNIDAQIARAEATADWARKELEQPEDRLDDLSDQKRELQKKIQCSQESIGTGSMKTKAGTCEAAMKHLMRIMAKGIPEDQERRRQMYGAVFNLNSTHRQICLGPQVSPATRAPSHPAMRKTWERNPSASMMIV